MLQRVVGIVLLSVSLAACGGKEEPKKEQALTPPPIDESPIALPLAEKADVEKAWTGSELDGVLITNATMLVTPTDGGVVLTRVNDEPDVSAGRTSGAFIEIPDSNKFDYSGFDIKVTVKAKSQTDTPAPFRVAYSTALKGNSGWNDFEANSDEQSFSFVYTVPRGHDTTPEFLGFATPDGSKVLISEVSVSLDF